MFFYLWVQSSIIISSVQSSIQLIQLSSVVSSTISVQVQSSCWVSVSVSPSWLHHKDPQAQSNSSWGPLPPWAYPARAVGGDGCCLYHWRCSWHLYCYCLVVVEMVDHRDEGLSFYLPEICLCRAWDSLSSCPFWKLLSWFVWYLCMYLFVYLYITIRFIW